MGYLLKSEVMEALHEDKETSLMCYDDKASKAIVKFCYNSMKYELDQMRLHEASIVNDEEMLGNDTMWIPVEEHLPEDGFANKLICDSDGNVKICVAHSRIKINGKKVFFPGNREILETFLNLTGVRSTEELDDITHIIAWMPLPEPYKKN